MSAERPRLPRAMGIAAGLLAAFAVAGAGLVAWTEQLTRERIEANERAYLLRALNEIVPRSAYGNDMFNDTIEVRDPELLGTPAPVKVYRARKDGSPVAVIMNPVAPDGYSGRIRLLVGISYEGEVTGVRVVSHRETPGLGDAIEAERSDWIHGFEGRSLGAPPVPGWAVERDGGTFDQLTGATITSRAVVNAVRNALLYFEANREALFAEPGAQPGEAES